MLASEMLNTVYAYLMEQPREKGMRKLEWAAFRSAITLLGFTVCCTLQGSLHALRDDIDNIYSASWLMGTCLCWCKVMQRFTLLPFNFPWQVRDVTQLKDVAQFGSLLLAIHMCWSMAMYVL